MKQTITICAFLLMICLPAFSLLAQEIKGVVTDEFYPIAGASIEVEKVKSLKSVTNIKGEYSLLLPEGSHTLKFTYSGYASQSIKVHVSRDEVKELNVTLEEKTKEENAFIKVGTRSKVRSRTNTALPIDVLSLESVYQTGQNTFDKSLNYLIPAFNSVQVPVNDATSILDPYEFRNMGPSRTLVLINGKRKNLSALLYTQISPGRGETATDISGIPIQMIDRIEILRDGASAQYGSDAIAGVMNLILKEKVDFGQVVLRSGATIKGDGIEGGLSINNGHTFDKRSYLNYTLDFSKIAVANRAGMVDAVGDAEDFGADLAVVEEFLERRPDAGNINGTPETTSAKFALHGGWGISNILQLYFNSMYVYKNMNSFANYRTPYWRTLAEYPYLADFFPSADGVNGYDGYLPGFRGILNDYNTSMGFLVAKGGWSIDASFTFGGNSQVYDIFNTHNGNVVYSPSSWIDQNANNLVDSGEVNQGVSLYRENSQLRFDPGGTKFSNYIGNIDISKQLYSALSIAIGAEFRNEVFEIVAGELASYDGGGSDSFSGNRPENSGKFYRYNLGMYLDLDWDITDNWLVNGTIRGENYSDFGNTFVWKASTRYKLWKDKIVVRGSVSTGFRAPTPHQIYTQKVQYSFLPSQGIQVRGLVNNVSPQARLIGVPNLTPEKSLNITVGAGARLSNRLELTVDYYNIQLKDRILLSTEIGRSEDGLTELDAILEKNGINDLSFFINAIDSRTSGIDFVLNYKNARLGTGLFSASLSGNYTLENRRIGAVKNPVLVEQANQSVLNRTQEALFFTSRPRTKWIFNLKYSLKQFDFILTNTYIGATEFKQQGLNEHLKTRFQPKVVTDLAFIYRISDYVELMVNANNLLNVLPTWDFVALDAVGQTLLEDPGFVKEQSNLITFNQRYSQMTYDGSHFSQLGALYNLAIKVKF